MWKKNEENGNLIVDDNGNPIWIDETNQTEKSFDYVANRKQISELTEKAHNRKDSIDKINSVLSENGVSLEELSDFIKEAKANKEKVDNLGKGGTSDVFKPYQEKIEALTTTIEKLKTEQKSYIAKQEDDKINSLFLESKYLKENSDAVLCRDIFKKNFKYEDGKLYGFLNGEKILNDMGEASDFETCIKKIIDNYPAKDKLLVGTVNGGAGSKGSNTTVKDYSNLSFAELCDLIDHTNDPVLKETLKQKLKELK